MPQLTEEEYRKLTQEEQMRSELTERRAGADLGVRAFDHLMRNSVSILQGRDDPLINDMTAYMRWVQARRAKAERGEIVDEAVFDASKKMPSPPLSRHGYRRF